MSRHWIASVAVILIASSSFAAAPKKTPPKAYLTVETAPLEYKLQGEYTGAIGNAKTGAQVIAYADGKFHAVLYPGGLPGDGWDQKSKTELDGQLSADHAEFTSPTLSFTLTPDSLTGKSADQTFELKKTIRQSPTLGAKAPEGAIILFDGANTDAWNPGQLDPRKLLMAQSGQGPTTKQKFADCTLHLEFILPFIPAATGQGRGNSGVYLQSRYEVQVLDSFGLKGVDNECGGFYKHAAPKVNMCFPPLSWQTYDIEFTAARFKDNKKIANATLTVRHNGVLIQDKTPLNASTTAAPIKTVDDTPAPLYLQNHGNPVFYRNIWIVEKK